MARLWGAAICIRLFLKGVQKSLSRTNVIIQSIMPVIGNPRQIQFLEYKGQVGYSCFHAALEFGIKTRRAPNPWDNGKRDLSTSRRQLLWILALTCCWQRLSGGGVLCGDLLNLEIYPRKPAASIHERYVQNKKTSLVAQKMGSKKKKRHITKVSL